MVAEGEGNYGIIIPTYNNARTLKKVIDGILKIFPAQKLIIVNDGSTDKTRKILRDYPETNQIHFKKNSGKGLALRHGFKKALAIGLTHVITIDSDGQHFPEDIAVLIAASKKDPSTLIIGARDMKKDGIPGKSSFGNNFSNFWFWFETGIKLTDTQSGFRVYPLLLLPQKWYTTKFEFEIESIVRPVWKGVAIKNIPIEIKYDEKADRISHFRPFMDFSRISVLNTVLVFTTLFYILPRKFLRNFKKKSLRTFIEEDILGNRDNPRTKATSLALGVFMGIIPIWGFQTAVVLFLAVAFRLNKLLAFAASNISIPPMIPVIVIASLKTGSVLMGNAYDFENYFAVSNIKPHLLEYLIGSFILAIFAAGIVGFSSYFILKRIEKK